MELSRIAVRVAANPTVEGDGGNPDLEAYMASADAWSDAEVHVDALGKVVERLPKVLAACNGRFGASAGPAVKRLAASFKAMREAEMALLAALQEWNDANEALDSSGLGLVENG